MKIVEEYKVVKNKHTEFFNKFNAKERIEFSDEITKLKAEADTIEKKIITGILRFTIDYSSIYNQLSSHNLHHFLKDNAFISKFLINQSISLSVGYNEKKRDETISQFKGLCKKVWEDFIITSDERNELNEFCQKNLIDKTQQFLIEQEISKKFTEGFDMVKIVEYYFLNENKSSESIKKILFKEYKKDVDVKRIDFIVSQLNDEISYDKDTINQGESQLIKTIRFNEEILIYLVVVDGDISSGYEFSIGFEPGTEKSIRVMISKNTYEISNNTRLKDIISDAVCYNLCSSDMSLRKFLETKVLVREQIEKQF